MHAVIPHICLWLGGQGTETTPISPGRRLSLPQRLLVRGLAKRYAVLYISQGSPHCPWDCWKRAGHQQSQETGCNELWLLSVLLSLCAPLGLELKVCTNTPGVCIQLYVGSETSHSGPDSRVTRALCTEPSPQPYILFLVVQVKLAH